MEVNKLKAEYELKLKEMQKQIDEKDQTIEQ